MEPLILGSNPSPAADRAILDQIMTERESKPTTFDKFSARLAGYSPLLGRLIFNSIARLAVHIVIRDPEELKELADREYTTGILADSILDSELYYPDSESDGLTRAVASAGLFIAHDFHRTEVFGPIVNERESQFQEGKLWTYPLPEIINNPQDLLSPTGLTVPFDFRQLMLEETATIEDLQKYGFIEQSTYKKVYKNVGLYEKYQQDILSRGIQDRKVYMITPKGNGLVFLWMPSGDKKERRYRDKSFVMQPAI